jgi:serine/threonine-protein kinase
MTSATAPVESFGTRSLLGEAGRDVSADTHRENLRRLRDVVRFGLVLWIVIGVPSDLSLATTFPDISFAALLAARVFGLIVFGLVGLRLRASVPISPALLRAMEVVAFGTAAACFGYFAVLDHGPRSASFNFATCILVAHGITMPRPWREGALALGGTLACFAATFASGLVWHPALAVQLADGASAAIGAYSLWLMLVAWLVLVLGGDAAHRIRRAALEAQKIGRYELKRVLGRGGMGEVWLAYHPGLRREVAVKLLTGARSEAARARFVREIDATAALTHPHTVRVLDRGTSEAGVPYYAMELVAGETLAERVRASGPLSMEAALRVLAQAARALAEAHALGIVHRDVKPANLMLTTIGVERDYLKVCDFGVATTLGATEREVVGTDAYAAPEQRSGVGDARSDVYGLGACLVYALTGEAPRGPDAADALAEPARAIARTCLALLPADRYADAAALAEALGAALDR